MTAPAQKDKLYELTGADPAIAQSRSVACIGGANLDRKLRSLQAPRMGTSNPAHQHESFGGVARNIAENLARLGAPVSLVTAVGDDMAGKALLAHAEAAGIDTRGSLLLAHRSSGTYTAVLDQQGDMLLALADMALYDELTPGVLARARPQRSCAALAVADLNLPPDTLRTLLGEAARGGVPLVFVAVSQPKMERLPADLTGLRLLILNQGELEARVGKAIATDAELAAACALVQAQGARDVIVTRGARGVACTAPQGLIHLDAIGADIVDVTGAGDAFAAAVCWTLYKGSDDLGLACRRGLRLSAMTLACAETVCPALAPGSLDAIDGILPPPPSLYQD